MTKATLPHQWSSSSEKLQYVHALSDFDERVIKINAQIGAAMVILTQFIPWGSPERGRMTYYEEILQNALLPATGPEPDPEREAFCFACAALEFTHALLTEYIGIYNSKRAELRSGSETESGQDQAE
jgi:hypothetical protein